MSIGDTFEEASISLVCENSNHENNNDKKRYMVKNTRNWVSKCVFCNAFEPQTWRRPFRLAKFVGEREDVGLYDNVFLL